MWCYIMKKKNQLINLFQSDSLMHWMNLPSDEKLDLKKNLDGHHNMLYVGKEKTFLLVLHGVSPWNNKFSIIFQK